MKKKIFIVLLILIIGLLLGLGGLYLYKEMTIEPVIQLIGENEIKININEEYIESGVKATIKDKDKTSEVIKTGKVDVTKPGIYEIVYTIENRRNKKTSQIRRTIKVVDNIPPQMTLKGDSEISIYQNSKYEELGCEAKDNVDGILDDKIMIEGKVDVKKIGTYELVYKVSDNSNNESIIKRKVNVKAVPVKKESLNLNTKVRGLPVLMYHFFYDDTIGEKGSDANWMSKTSFEAQMKYLSDNNYYFPTWQEVEDFIDGKIELPAKSVLITVDDCDATFLNIAVPIINKYNVKATSFVVTSWNGNWVPTTYRSSHLDFQSHSHDCHRSGSKGRGRIVNISYEEALNDVIKSRDVIGNSIVFCYPFGHYNDTVIEVLKAADYKLAFTTEYNRVYPGANKFKLPRIRMSRGDSLETFIKKVK